MRRSQSQHRLSRLGERFRPQHQDIAEAGGKLGRIPTGGQQLLGKERVALRAPMHAFDQIGAGRRIEDAAQLRFDLLARERLQIDSFGGRRPSVASEERP